MAHTPRELWDRVVSQAAEAATDASRWSGLVRDINQLFGARSTALFTPEPAAHIQPLGITHGDLADGVESYFADWAHEDAWLKAVAGKNFFQRAGEARFSREFLPDAELRKTAFFHDWAHRFSAEQTLALKVTDQQDPDAPVLHLTLFRRLADQPFTQQDRTRLQVLWPHLRRAAQAHWALQPLRQGSPAIEATLETLPLPAWVVRSDAHIEFANAEARALMNSAAWAQARWGRLHRIGDMDAAALQRHIADGQGFSKQQAHMSALSVDDDGRRRGRILHVHPIAQTVLYACTWPRAQALLMLQAVTTPEQVSLLQAHLRHQFGLTAAEGATLRGLGQGMTVEAIATSQGVAIGTIRTHVNKLLSKTTLSKQADLVRLALGV